MSLFPCSPPGNRMFSFNEEDVDLYLPQLLNMYIHMHDVAEAIHPYIVARSDTFYFEKKKSSVGSIAELVQ